jgi:RND superfamily putative drug exporter
MDMSVFVTNMASMIGIGVAVDYSLFILARYREEIRAGADRAAARATAMATSGTAVAFSGLTVIVSLAGLWMIDNQALRSMALGAMLVVAVSVVASATLLPVLIALFGRRAYAHNRLFTITGLLVRSRAPRRPGSTCPDVERLGFWRRWTNAVMRRPVIAVVATSSLLLVLAAPVLSLHTSTGALAQFPKGNETRVGFEAAASLGGRGASGPVAVLVRFHRGTAAAPDNRAAVDAVRLRLAGDPQVVRVAGVRIARDSRAALVTAIPRRESEATATKHLVAQLRHDLPRTVPAAATAVGGSAARQYDVENMISGSMWKIILFVLGLSYVVLLILLRSVVLPLKAVLMNLLSVGAAYGVLVVVFQWGWLDGLLGFSHLGHLDVLTPPLVLAVVFGLSMDYEVFLLSRIRERWEATGDSRQAVAEGLAASARTITSAALIMASVFMVFTFTGVPSIKELGLGNAVAILIDATIVRLILVPATMELLGDWNWWLPKPLARILPRRSFERTPEPAPAN